MFKCLKGKRLREKYVKKLFIGAKIVTVAAMVVSSFPLIPNVLAAGENYSTNTNDQGDIFIGGEYIELGINKYGTFGSLGSPTKESGFHNSEMPGSTYNQIGMIANENGWSSNKVSSTCDFFLPGWVDEGWTFAYKDKDGNPQVAYAESNDKGSAIAENVLNSKTELITIGEKKAVKTTLDLFKEDKAADTTAKIKLIITYSFDVKQKGFHTTVEVEKLVDEPMSEMRFMRAFDPDQNSHLDSAYTYQFIENKGTNGARITSYGKANQAAFIYDTKDFRAKVGFTGAFHINSESEGWVYKVQDETYTKNTPNVNEKSVYEDGDIFIYFDLADTSKGGKLKFEYDSLMDAYIGSLNALLGKLPKEVNSDNIFETAKIVEDIYHMYDKLSDMEKTYIDKDLIEKILAYHSKAHKIIKDEKVSPLVKYVSPLSGELDIIQQSRCQEYYKMLDDIDKVYIEEIQLQDNALYKQYIDAKSKLLEYAKKYNFDLEDIIVPDRNEFKDKKTGIVAKFEKLYNSHYDLDVLNVSDKLPLDLIKEDLKNTMTDYLLTQIYDVRLLKDGLETVVDDKITIKIPYSLLEEGYSDYKVVYIDDNNQVSQMTSTYKNGEYLEFTTGHLSYYGIVGFKEDIKEPIISKPTQPETKPEVKPETKPETKPVTSDLIQVGPYSQLMGLSALYVFIDKKNKDVLKKYRK